MIVERATGTGVVTATGPALGRRAGALTFLLVVVGWVFFRAESIGQALTMIRHMFVPSGFGAARGGRRVAHQPAHAWYWSWRCWWCCCPGSFVLGRVLESGRSRPAVAARFAVMAVAAPCAAVIAAAGTFSPFLYYQF